MRLTVTIISQDFGDTPWRCDAGSMTRCSRPRFYWITWDLVEGEGVHFEEGGSYYKESGSDS